MYTSCSRVLPSPSLVANPVTCIRNIGVIKVKAARAKKKDKKNVPLISSKKARSPVRNERQTFKNTFADVPHNVSPIIRTLEPEISNKLYSKFCMRVLKPYGFSLQFSHNSKCHSNLSGSWHISNREFNIEASCTLHCNDNIRQIRNNDSLLLKSAPEKTIGILINNAGFKIPTIRKFAHSENPCILLSVFDRTTNWLSEPSEAHFRRQKIKKCLHNQVWDADLGYSTHKFGHYEVEVPECNLTRGLSLVLFNKAFVSLLPELSAGKLIYEWPAGSKEKHSLKTNYQSTILVRNEMSGRPERIDLYDAMEEKRIKKVPDLRSIKDSLTDSVGADEFSIAEYLAEESEKWDSKPTDFFGSSRIFAIDSQCVLPSRSGLL